ncbi:hypothetical protein AA313_de0205809 [Arthrobotrys entomopaga]|nr:hypothetical protein AA313_de0205809 [Arthrobotrys entomopaga]
MRMEFRGYRVSKTDFIKALMAPNVTSSLDNFIQQHHNEQIRKLSTKTLIRFLKTEPSCDGCARFDEQRYPDASILDALKASIHISQNIQPGESMLTESTLDTLDLEEDEYTIAEKNEPPDPTAPTLNSLIQHLFLFLTGYDSIDLERNDSDSTSIQSHDTDLYLLVRQRKAEMWGQPPYHPYRQLLTVSLENYIKRRDDLDPDIPIGYSQYSYPWYLHYF